MPALRSRRQQLHRDRTTTRQCGRYGAVVACADCVSGVRRQNAVARWLWGFQAVVLCGCSGDRPDAERILGAVIAWFDAQRPPHSVSPAEAVAVVGRDQRAGSQTFKITNTSNDPVMGSVSDTPAG